jgi:large subunit ribosomal protein L5
LAEEKPIAPPGKKVVVEKKADKVPAPGTETQAAPTKEATEVKITAAEKKSVVKQKAREKLAVEKLALKDKVTEPKGTSVKDENIVEAEGPPAERKRVEKKEEPRVVKPPRKAWVGNPMLMPVIEKVTVNMSVGQSGRPLEQAETILKKLTNQKPSKRKAKKTVREFGIRKGESIACLVTLRGENAEDFLRKAFYAVENKLSKYCFDRQGNFAFGIKEHIDIPGIKYSPELGIHGMDVAVSLGRAGYRVKRRHRNKSKIGKGHLLTAKEAILFIKDEFDVEIA